MKLRSTAIVLSSLWLGLVLLTGCPPKKKLVIEDPKAEDITQDADADALQPGDIRINQDWTEVPGLGVVNFDYNSAALSSEARAALKGNVAILKKLPQTVVVRVEGHCDDRGTVEYNIALGQRRANAVSSYYVTAGIAKNRLDTISFGEERPLCVDQTDMCWAKNRRSATKLKNKETITIKAEELK